MSIPGESDAFPIPALKWLGLHYSDLEQHHLPSDALQRTTTRDESRLRNLLCRPVVRVRTPFLVIPCITSCIDAPLYVSILQSSPRIQAELLLMQQKQIKFECEAFHTRRIEPHSVLLSHSQSYFTRDYVVRKLLRGQFVD